MKYLLAVLMLVKLYANTGQTIKEWDGVKKRTIYHLPGGQVKFKDADGLPVYISGNISIEKSKLTKKSQEH